MITIDHCEKMFIQLYDLLENTDDLDPKKPDETPKFNYEDYEYMRWYYDVS